MMLSKWLFATGFCLLIPAAAAAEDSTVTAKSQAAGAKSPAATAKTPAATTPNPANAVTPDRPGFTNGSDVVPRGRIQIEGGVTRTLYGAGAGRATDAPEILIRTGLSDTTELT